MSPSRPLGRGGLNLFSPGPAKPSSMELPQLTLCQWLLAALAALSVGLAKSGFGGIGMLTVTLMAAIMKGHERESTGVVLPLLICGDLFAVWAFRRHVRWGLLVRMLPPALFGVGLGYLWMSHLSNAGFKPLIGWIVIALTAVQIWRQLRPAASQNIPHSRRFAWLMGILAGVTTMLANAAGPVMTLYFLVLQLPKLEFVSTAAWFFLVVNLSKVPLSVNLGLIHPGSLLFNAALAPLVAVGVLAGRSVIHRIEQKRFEQLLIGLTALTALHLIFS